MKNVLLAAVAIKTDSILASMTLHAAINVSGVIVSLLTMDISMVTCAILAIVGAVISFGTGYLVLKNSKS